MNDRFEFPFRENYQTIDGVRLHYVDEGEGPVLWLMHGNTTWSYLYRKMIPPLVSAGYRCVAPDLMGFGLSDKPPQLRAYSLQRHVGLMTKLVEHLQLRDIVPVGHDWGGPITQRYAIEHRDNVRALVILDTFIERFPANHREREQKGMITGPLPPGFALLFKGGGYSSFLIRRLDLFRKFVWQKWKTGNRSRLLGAGFRRPVDPRAMRQYLGMNDTAAKRAGLVSFAKMIPNSADHPNADYVDAIRRALAQWDVPVLVVWADGDMAWKPDEGALVAQLVPDGEFYLVRNAGHFLQEDAGEEIAARIIRFLRSRDIALPRSPGERYGQSLA